MDTHTQRREPLAGVLFGVLLTMGGLLVSSGLPYGAAATEVVSHLEEASGRIAIGGALVLLSAAPLLWFVASLHRRLEADGDDGRLAGVVSTAGGAVAAVVLVAATAAVGAVARTGFEQSVEPAGAALAWDLFGAGLGTALPVAMAVLIAATVVAGRRSGWFAPGAAWLSWGLVLGLLALPVAWIFAGGAVLWVAAVSIAMTVGRPVGAGSLAGRPRPA